MLRASPASNSSRAASLAATRIEMHRNLERAYKAPLAEFVSLVVNVVYYLRLLGGTS
ncbi:MAG: hypothetical protein PHY05_06650 [Methanothrix sp.]|nr:hypothetical protein [Methanothrix sp.]